MLIFAIYRTMSPHGQKGLTALFPTTLHSALVPQGLGEQGSPTSMMLGVILLGKLFDGLLKDCLGGCLGVWKRLGAVLSVLLVGHPSIVL